MFNATTILSLIGLVGLAMMVRGWTNRVRDGGAYCRRCGYRVDLGMSERCAECGLLLGPNTIVATRRERRQSLMALGAVLSLAAGMILSVRGYAHLNRMNLAPILPTWVLLRAETTPLNEWGEDVVIELRKRVADGALSSRQRARFSEMLTVRATHMNQTSPGSGSHNITGSSLSLWEAHPPDEPLLTNLLDAVVDRQARSSDPPLVGAFNTDQGVFIVLRERIFLPYRYWFDDTHSYPTLRIRPEVIAVKSAGTESERLTTDWSSGIRWLALPELNGGEEIVVTVRYDWLLDRTDPLADARPVRTTWWEYLMEPDRANLPDESDPKVRAWSRSTRTIELTVPSASDSRSRSRSDWWPDAAMSPPPPERFSSPTPATASPTESPSQRP